jgi:hypothetical protein
VRRGRPHIQGAASTTPRPVMNTPTPTIEKVQRDSFHFFRRTSTRPMDWCAIPPRSARRAASPRWALP